jgi:hypothetical protein
MQYTKNTHKIVCFEPDNDNFARLSAILKKQRVAAEQILLPCGVWKEQPC